MRGEFWTSIIFICNYCIKWVSSFLVYSISFLFHCEMVWFEYTQVTYIKDLAYLIKMSDTWGGPVWLVYLHDALGNCGYSFQSKVSKKLTYSIPATSSASQELGLNSWWMSKMKGRLAREHFSPTTILWPPQPFSLQWYTSSVACPNHMLPSPDIWVFWTRPQYLGRREVDHMNV